MANSPIDDLLALLPHAVTAPVFDRSGSGSFGRLADFNVTIGATPDVDPNRWNAMRETFAVFGADAKAYHVAATEAGHMIEVFFNQEDNDAAIFYDLTLQELEHVERARGA